MASWMIHLRVAQGVMDAFPQLSATEFIMGNIAPDSGIPKPDGAGFEPPKSLSHFKVGDDPASPALFAEKYLAQGQRCYYTNQSLSFYLGYLSHLVTDRMWSLQIARPTVKKYPEREYMAMIKKDWYDLDFLYLKKHPDFSAFRIYRYGNTFPNRYMEEFSLDAFEDRRRYILEFYRQIPGDLARVYQFLTEREADAFVEAATVETIAQIIAYLT